MEANSYQQTWLRISNYFLGMLLWRVKMVCIGRFMLLVKTRSFINALNKIAHYYRCWIIRRDTPLIVFWIYSTIPLFHNSPFRDKIHVQFLICGSVRNSTLKSTFVRSGRRRGVLKGDLDGPSLLDFIQLGNVLDPNLGSGILRGFESTKQWSFHDVCSGLVRNSKQWNFADGWPTGSESSIRGSR